MLALRAFWCVWLSSLLPRAVVTLEWHSSLLGLLAECVGTGVVLEGSLLPDLGRLDGLSGRRACGVKAHGASKIGGQCLYWFPQVASLGWGLGKRNGAHRQFCSWRGLLKTRAPPAQVLQLVNKSSVYPRCFSDCCFSALSWLGYL